MSNRLIICDMIWLLLLLLWLLLLMGWWCCWISDEFEWSAVLIVASHCLMYNSVYTNMLVMTDIFLFSIRMNERENNKNGEKKSANKIVYLFPYHIQYNRSFEVFNLVSFDILPFIRDKTMIKIHGCRRCCYSKLKEEKVKICSIWIIEPYA